jgi:hypothetical protein
VMPVGSANTGPAGCATADPPPSTALTSTPTANTMSFDLWRTPNLLHPDG